MLCLFRECCISLLISDKVLTIIYLDVKSMANCDFENYFFDIDNMRKFDDDEYFYHLWDIMQDVEKELEEVEFSNNLNFCING